MSIRNARKLFETFHEKRAGTPVYPFDGEAEGEFELDIVLPPMRVAGVAVRTMYRADKWEEPGVTHDYYHDHIADEALLWLPAGQAGESDDFSYAWPDSVTHLGEALKLYYREPNAKTDELVECSLKNAVLVASPAGHVSRLRSSRVFLAVVDLETSQVEALVTGNALRLTARGIEG